MGLFSREEPKTRAVVTLSDDLEDVSVMDIHKALSIAGFSVVNVHATPVRNSSEQPRLGVI